MDINNSQSTWPAGSAPPFLETTPEASSAWEHSDECDPEVETWLTLTTATRDQAETARQKVAEEILEATRRNVRNSSSAGITPYRMPSVWKLRLTHGTPKLRPS